MKAEDIISKCRKDIADFIRYEATTLCPVLNIQPDDEGYIVIESEQLARCPKISVSVDNSYLDIYDDTREIHKVSSIVVENKPEGEILFITEENDELTPNDITIEELSTISNILEETYLKKI